MALYLEDDDELRKMRERFMQADPGGAAGSGNPYGAPPRDLDPSTVQSFLAQREAPRDYAYPIPQRESGPGISDWFPLAAAGLDLAFNRGRGMGSIAQSAAGMAQRRDALAQQQFEDDRNAYLKQGEAAARDRQIDLAGRNADMRQQEIDAALAKEKAIQARWLEGRPDPELERRAKEAEVNLTEARAYKAWTEDPNALDADRAADRDMRKQMHDEDLADRRAGREAAAAATAAQREATALAKQQRQDTIDENARQGRLNKFRDETEKTRPALGNLQRLEAIIAKPEYAKDLPGVGMLDSRTPRWAMSDDAIAVQSLRGDIGDLLGRQRSGSAIPPAEYARLSAFSSGGEHATEKEFREVLALYKKHLFAEAQQQSAGREDDAREVLGPLGDYALGPRAPVVPAPTAQITEPEPAPIRLGGQRGAAGGGNNFGFSGPPPAGDALPVTGQRPGQVPKVNDYLRRLQGDDEDLGVVYR